MIYVGHRDSSMLLVLKHYIPTAATFGGVCIAILTLFADLIGAIGSGINYSIKVDIRYRRYNGCVYHLWVF